MKYFPVFERKIDMQHEDITTQEIGEMMAKIYAIRVINVDDHEVKCRKENLIGNGYHNSFLPVMGLSLVKNEGKSQLICRFQLRKFVQILVYAINSYGLLMQILLLIMEWGRWSLPCFIPLLMILWGLLLPYFGLYFQVRSITDDINWQIRSHKK